MITPRPRRATPLRHSDRVRVGTGETAPPFAVFKGWDHELSTFQDFDFSRSQTSKTQSPKSKPREAKVESPPFENRKGWGSLAETDCRFILGASCHCRTEKQRLRRGTGTRRDPFHHTRLQGASRSQPSQLGRFQRSGRGMKRHGASHGWASRRSLCNRCHHY